MGTYWNGDGAHQQAYLDLYKELVPPSGRCDTVEGELLRAASKLLHEAYNNGWGNNLSGAANFMKRYGNIDAETIEYLDENANVGRSGRLDEVILDRMLDMVVIRARDADPRTPNTVDLLSLSDPEGYVEAETDDLEEEEEEDDMEPEGKHP